MSWAQRRRRITDRVMIGLAGLFAGVVLVPLVSVLYYVISRGLRGVNWEFFTRLPAPVGDPGGGMANALVGSAIVVGTASLMAVPFGLAAGIYLAGDRGTKTAWWVRFAADVLSGTPSIVAGAFCYAVVVMPMKTASAWAGACALAVLMLPVVTRTTEEMVRLVPASQRDGGMAVGATLARTNWSILLPAALPGVLTGILLATARIAGETAPLLHTALSNQHWSLSLDKPIATLPVMIYTYALSPFDEWQQQAWTGALVLVSATLLMSLLARWATRRRIAL